MTPEMDRALAARFAGHHDLDAVRFPALLYGDALEPAAGANVLRLATAWALENGGVVGARIWDSAGQEFVIAFATPEIDLGGTGITRWVGLSYRLDGPRAVAFAEVCEVIRGSDVVGRHAAKLAAASDFGALYRMVASLHPHEL